MGRTIAIGDVHGCADELESLLQKINPQDNDRIIQLGDLINKGPHNHEVIQLARAFNIEVILGNHEHRIIKYNKKEKTNLLKSYELKTLKQLSTKDLKFLKKLPSLIYENKLNTIFVHGGFVPGTHWYNQDLETISSVQVINKDGKYGKRKHNVNSKYWPYYWTEKIDVIYGHTPRKRTYKKNNTLCLDTGCVYGGHLTAYCLEEKTYYKIKAKKDYT